MRQGGRGQGAAASLPGVEARGGTTCACLVVHPGQAWAPAEMVGRCGRLKAVVEKAATDLFYALPAPSCGCHAAACLVPCWCCALCCAACAVLGLRQGIREAEQAKAQAQAEVQAQAQGGGAGPKAAQEVGTAAKDASA